jgi:hypothetical protein
MGILATIPRPEKYISKCEQKYNYCDPDPECDPDFEVLHKIQPNLGILDQMRPDMAQLKLF